MKYKWKELFICRIFKDEVYYKLYDVFFKFFLLSCFLFIIGSVEKVIFDLENCYIWKKIVIGYVYCGVSDCWMFYIFLKKMLFKI